MKKAFTSLAALALLAAYALPLHADPAPSAPPAAMDTRTPLVTIRFNQPHPYYKKALYDAVSSAVTAKPDVIFDVVLYPAAEGGKPGAAAQENLRQVVAALKGMGTADSRLTARQGAPSGQRYDEICVYVR